MIFVAGTIGAGKSSLTKMLAHDLGSVPFFESVEDNEVLPLFYSDPQKYAFLLQIYFLNKRFLAMKEALVHPNNVMDRSIYEDSLLFHLNADLGRVSAVEVTQYDKLLDTMLAELEDVLPQKQPDLMIHIKVSLDTMLARIKKRGREYEQLENDPAIYDYYKELNQRYDEWYEQFNLCPKIQIDGDIFDFVTNDEAATTVLARIKQELLTLQDTPETKAIYYSNQNIEKGIFNALIK